jgi:ketosteroid isomerase-like protein
LGLLQQLGVIPAQGRRRSLSLRPLRSPVEQRDRSVPAEPRELVSMRALTLGRQWGEGGDGVGVAEEIHEANKRFQEAIRAADSQTMPSLCTGDAKILPPNADAVSGADAIEAYWQSFFDLGIAGAQPNTEEVIPMGEYALETPVLGLRQRALYRSARWAARQAAVRTSAVFAS